MMTDASSDISGAAWQPKCTLLAGRFTATLIGTTRRETLRVATLRSASMSSNTDSGEPSTNLISGIFASSDIVLLLEVRGLAFDVSEGLRQRRHTVAEKAVAGEDRRVGRCGRSERICASWGSPPQEFRNVEPVIGGWRNGGQPRFQFVDFGAECEI